MPKINTYDQKHMETAASRIHGADISLLNAVKTRDYTGKDIVCFGMPFTTGDHMNQGTNKAPNAVREQSPYYTSDMYPYPSHYDINRIADGGNLVAEVPTDSARDCLMNLRAQVKAELAKGDFRPLFIGGDHTIPYSTLAGVSEHLDQPLAVLHFDAHPDSGNFVEINQGTFMYELTKTGHIDAANSFQFFLRTDVHTDGEYRDVTDQFTIYDAFAMHAEMRRDGYDDLVEKIKTTMGNRPVWISFDIDAIDASCAPGTTIPMHNGATSEELAMIFYKLSQAGLNVVGGEVVELIPDLDTASKTTCGLAARLMRDFAYLSYQAAQREI